jgi:alpha-L-fucosidase
VARPILPLAAFFVLAACVCTPSHPPPGEAPSTAQPSGPVDRMAWWHEARFGMFIHWGLYAVPAGTYKGEKVDGFGEWIMERARIPVADYAKLAADFDPTAFDADAWVRTAQEAGMKYIVFTAKHHDGFAMWRSRVSPFNIHDATPWKRDPLAELAEACRRRGVPFGLYYSQAQDWHHPGGATLSHRWDRAQAGSMDDYLRDVAVPELRELLTGYGKIAVLWWDTPADMTEERAQKLLPLLDLQPGIITNNRLGGGVPGDTETPEQYVPATGSPGRSFEVCMTMNGTWGYKADDQSWKPTEKLLRKLIDIASKGGNYLLNVGPTAEGVIPAPSVERLREMGAWLARNGEAIHGTTASPFLRYSFDGRATVRGNRMYLHVFQWPAPGEALRVVGLTTPVRAATFLDGGGKAEISSTTDSRGVITLTVLPPPHPDPYATVVVLDLDGAPRVDLASTTLGPEPDGSFSLIPSQAVVDGDFIRHEGDHIAAWASPRDRAAWTFTAPAASDYDVEITYGCADASSGSEYAVSVDAARLASATSPTGGYGRFVTESVGRVHLDAGAHTLVVKPTRKPRGVLMNLREIRLSPIKP